MVENGEQYFVYEKLHHFNLWFGITSTTTLQKELNILIQRIIFFQLKIVLSTIDTYRIVNKSFGSYNLRWNLPQPGIWINEINIIFDYLFIYFFHRHTNQSITDNGQIRFGFVWIVQFGDTTRWLGWCHQ